MADSPIPRPWPREPDRDVAGFCPMGCGNSLVLGDGGGVTCRSVDCPDPGAVARILRDPETEHIVQLGADIFTVRHPLRERLNDDLMICRLHMVIASFDSPPEPPGRYRVTGRHGDRVQAWSWERIDG